MDDASCCSGVPRSCSSWVLVAASVRSTVILVDHLVPGAPQTALAGYLLASGGDTGTITPPRPTRITPGG